MHITTPTAEPDGGYLVWDPPPTTVIASTFYGVRVGEKPGVYTSWADAHKVVTGFPNAAHQKFHSFAEAAAFVWGLGWQDQRPWYYHPGGSDEANRIARLYALAGGRDPSLNPTEFNPPQSPPNIPANARVFDPSVDTVRDAYKTAADAAIRAAAVACPPNIHAYAKRSSELYPDAPHIFPSCPLHTDASTPTAEPSVAGASFGDVHYAAASDTASTVSDVPTVTSMDSLAASFESLQMPPNVNRDIVDRYLVLPPGVPHCTDTSALSTIIVHGLDKQGLNYDAILVIASVAKAHTNPAHFKHLCKQAGLSKTEAVELYCDIVTYPVKN